MTLTDTHGSCAVWAPASERVDWRDRSACKGHEDLFLTDTPDLPLVRAMCALCPVQEPCLGDALRAGSVHYFRAGFRASELERLTKDYRWCVECDGRFAPRYEKQTTCRRPSCVESRRARLTGEGPSFSEIEVAQVAAGVRGVFASLRSKDSIDRAVSL